MDQEKIGAFIKEVRKENGLTQEQLAEKLGVSQKSVSRWENGKNMPDYSLLPSLCEILNINVAELLNAQRIEGDSITKNDVTTTAHKLIKLMDNHKLVRQIMGAFISVIVTLACMVALFNAEFNVTLNSTAYLEKAINEYHFAEACDSDVLEIQPLGKHLYVLYGKNDFPGASGLACLERGVFGRYRIVSCRDTSSRWINLTTVSDGKKKYCISYCVNDLAEIDAYGLLGVEENASRNLTIEDAELIQSINYVKSPFLTITELKPNITLAPFEVKYFKSGTEIPEDELTNVLGPHVVEGASNSGTGTAELGMVYVFEGILFLIGIMFVRYFLTT